MPIDVNDIRDYRPDGNSDRVRELLRRRFQSTEILDELIHVDAAWRTAAFELDTLLKERNDVSKQIGAMKKAGEDSSDIMDLAKHLPTQIQMATDMRDDFAADLNRRVKSIGNYVHDSVPVSDNEDDNVIVRSSGECARSEEWMQHHHELLYRIGGYEPEAGAAIAGHRGYFLTGPAVLLNQALLNYGLAFLMKKQYTPIQPPYFMNQEVMAETAQLDEFHEALYKVVGHDDDANVKYLIATSEQPISALHRNKWLQAKDLPLRYAGISTCFRREAGSHGRDAWGIFRVHQFEKIEQFVIAEPDKSWEMMDEMIGAAEEFYKSLGLSYQVVSIVSGALNNTAAKKLDLEAWFPTLGVFRELVSCSNCTDYQSRAMETRLGMKDAKSTRKVYPHMLNATLTATERTICCLLENYQTETGVKVPEALQPFMGGIDFLPFVRERTGKAPQTKS